MAAFRLLRVVQHLFLGLAICALVFPFIGAAGRSAHIKRWSHRLLALCRVEVHISDAGIAEARRALIVSNHVSWLDIFVINTLHPCRFVAKADIRNWPLIGWLCEKTGTIFISRGKLRDMRRIFQGIVAGLQAGEHVAFFPESTTAAQGALLPFHANLFEAAIEAEVPVQPFALRYTDSSGKLHPAVDFVGGMTFVQSMLAILKSGKITAQLLVLPAIPTEKASHRRELADAAYASIAQALGYTEEVPETRRAS